MSTVSSTLAQRYVTALLDAANAAQGGIQTVERDLTDLQAMIAASKDLRDVLASPLMPVATQVAAVMAVVEKAKFSDMVQGFVRVVLQNRRGPQLAGFVAAALAEITKRNGVTQAQVDVAAPLSTAQEQQLVTTLSKWTGTKVQLKVRVANDVLAGMRVRFGDIQIDDTVAGKLSRLKQNLLGSKQVI